MRSTFKVLFYVNKSKEKDGILWNREIHKLPLWPTLVRYVGTFKRNAH